MGKPNKTELVITAMKKQKTVTIGLIRLETGLPAHEIGGILASLARQERVARAEVADATRNHWQLLRAEKRPRSAIDSGVISPALRRKLEDRAREDAANQSAVMLQNIVLSMSNRVYRSPAYA